MGAGAAARHLGAGAVFAAGALEVVVVLGAAPVRDVAPVLGVTRPAAPAGVVRVLGAATAPVAVAVEPGCADAAPGWVAAAPGCPVAGG